MPLVHIKTRRLEYKFELTRKFNFVLGDSATGKTELILLITALNRSAAGFQVSGYTKLIVLPTVGYANTLATYNDHIIFMDENHPALYEYNTATMLMNSNNYFVIFTRTRKFDYLPVDGRSFYKIKTSGAFHTLETMYQNLSTGLCGIPYVICEDSNSGRDFLKQMLPQAVVIAEVSSEYKKSGRSTLSVQLERAYAAGERNVMLVYDLVGIGHDYFRLLDVIKGYPDLNVVVLDWDSFEGYILQSPLINEELVEGCINNIEQAITEKLKTVLPKYSKNKLAPCLQYRGCATCSEAYSCPYMHMDSNKLIYAKLQRMVGIVDGLSGSSTHTLKRLNVFSNDYNKL